MRTKKQIMRNEFFADAPYEAMNQLNKFIEDYNINNIINISENRTTLGDYRIVLFYYEPDKRFTDDYRD
jgi:hypothetical protein